MWQDPKAKTLEAMVEPENRLARIVSYEGRIWTIIYTLRGVNCRIISVRRSWDKEIRHYG